MNYFKQKKQEMKSTNSKNSLKVPSIEISIEEYEYLKSLEDAIKHPERYKDNDDPDYLTPEEIVLVYEANKKIKAGDLSNFISLDEYLAKTSKGKNRINKSKVLLVSDKKNVYSKNRKKSSKVS